MINFLFPFIVIGVVIYFIYKVVLSLAHNYEDDNRNSSKQRFLIDSEPPYQALYNAYMESQKGMRGISFPTFEEIAIPKSELIFNSTEFNEFLKSCTPEYDPLMRIRLRNEFFDRKEIVRKVEEPQNAIDSLFSSMADFNDYDFENPDPHAFMDLEAFKQIDRDTARFEIKNKSLSVFIKLFPSYQEIYSRKKVPIIPCMTQSRIRRYVEYLGISRREWNQYLVDINQNGKGYELVVI